MLRSESGARQVWRPRRKTQTSLNRETFRRAAAALIPCCSSGLLDPGCFKEPYTLRLKQFGDGKENSRRGQAGFSAGVPAGAQGRKKQKEKRRNSATKKAKFSTVELQRQLLGFRKSLKEKKKKKEQQQKKNENICLSVTKAHQCKPSQNQYTHLFADLNKEKLHIAINNL